MGKKASSVRSARRKSTRRGATLTLGMLVGAATTFGLNIGTAGASTSFSFARVFGTDRYGTAAQLALKGFPHGAHTVILATGADYPDALAATYLAGTENGGSGAPILLTEPNSLPAVTLSTLASLGVNNVIIVGGPLAVSQAVYNELVAQHYSVSRLAGHDRYGTMQAVDTVPQLPVGTVNGLRTAIVASGANFPDALAAGPAAYASHLPIVLTDPSTLSLQARTVLRNLGIQQVLIMGGTLAVSSAVQAQITSLGISVLVRFAGTDRTATAADAAKWFVANLGMSNTSVDVARGDMFPDALSGAPYAGESHTPILLTADVDNLGGAAGAFITLEGATLQSGTVFGGPAAVSDGVMGQAVTAVQTGTVPSPPPVSGAGGGGSSGGGGGSYQTPTITGVSPSGGPLAGGTTVIITGTNLTGGTVTFGSTPAPGACTQNSCSVTSPATKTASSVPVTVTTPGGTASAVRGFIYANTTPPPSASTAPVSVATQEVDKANTGQLAVGDVLSVTFDQPVGLDPIGFTLTLTDGTNVGTLNLSSATASLSQDGKTLTYTVTGPPSMSRGTSLSLTELEILSQKGISDSVGPWNLALSGSVVQGGSTSTQPFSRVFGGTNANLPLPPGLYDVIPYPTPDLPGPPGDFAPEVITACQPGSGGLQPEQFAYDEVTGNLLGKEPCNYITPDPAPNGSANFAYIPVPNLGNYERVVANQADPAGSTYVSATVVPPEITNVTISGQTLTLTYDQPVTCPAASSSSPPPTGFVTDNSEVSQFQYGPAGDLNSKDLVYASSNTCSGTSVTANFERGPYNTVLLDASGKPLPSGSQIRFKYSGNGLEANNVNPMVTAAPSSPYYGTRAASQSVLLTLP